MPDDQLRDVEALTDCELLKRITENDQFAFEALWKRYWKMVHNICWAMSRNEGKAEDWTEDVFTKICEKPLLYLNAAEKNDECSIKAYLRQVTRNHCLSKMRPKENQTEEISIDNPSTNEQGDTFYFEVPDRSTSDPELTVVIDSVMMKLPLREREVVSLRFEAGYTRAEVAVLWKMTPQNVGVIERKAKRRFAELFPLFSNREKNKRRSKH